MKKKAQKFSFIMMIVFCLSGIALTIVAAVAIGTGFGTLSALSSAYGSSISALNPLAKYVFPTILGGLVVTFSVTAVWWSVLEHFSNVEKSLDRLYRVKTEKEELPDNAYSYLPAFIENMANQPRVPAYPPYQPYPPQYAQPQNQMPTQPTQQAQPVQFEQPVQPVQPPVQSAPPVQQAEQAQPVQPPVMPEQELPPVLPEQAPAAQEQEDWFCTHCGAPNKFDSNFCSTCGNKR